MKFFDDKSKTVNWRNRNYFYIGTIFIIVLNILLFVFLGNNFEEGIGGEHVWNGVFDISNLVRSFVDVFVHGDWAHVLLNMLCFAFCGIYIERKVGTFNFLLMVVGFAFLAGAVTTAARNTVAHYGASGLVYFCYAYVIIDYIFSIIKKDANNKTNLILGGIILFCIYVAMCYCEERAFPFVIYPHDFLFNAAHYSSFFAGIIVTIMLKVAKYSKK